MSFVMEPTQLLYNVLLENLDFGLSVTVNSQWVCLAARLESSWSVCQNRRKTITVVCEKDTSTYIKKSLFLTHFCFCTRFSKAIISLTTVWLVWKPGFCLNFACVYNRMYINVTNTYTDNNYSIIKFSTTYHISC